MKQLDKMPDPPEPVLRDMRKTVCTITREHFEKEAQPLNLSAVLAGIFADIQRQKDGSVGFATGSLGWRLNTKIVVEVGGVPVTIQAQGNFTVVGSKELPKEPK